jgi:hypothetical protein
MRRRGKEDIFILTGKDFLRYLGAAQWPLRGLSHHRRKKAPFGGWESRSLTFGGRRSPIPLEKHGCPHGSSLSSVIL